MTDPMRFAPDGTILERCGFAATCGRPLGHRGHHGGWRSGIAAVSPKPYAHATRDTYRMGSELTPGDLTILVEYAYHHSAKDVADCIGLSRSVVNNHLEACRTRTGASSISEVYVLLGWLEIPPGLGDRHADERGLTTLIEDHGLPLISIGRDGR